MIMKNKKTKEVFMKIWKITTIAVPCLMLFLSFSGGYSEAAVSEKKQALITQVNQLIVATDEFAKVSKGTSVSSTVKSLNTQSLKLKRFVNSKGGKSKSDYLHLMKTMEKIYKKMAKEVVNYRNNMSVYSGVEKVKSLLNNINQMLVEMKILKAGSIDFEMMTGASPKPKTIK
jgi:hypothetical protein